MNADTASSSAADAVGSSETLLGMAALGKTAAALGLVIAIILVCTVLLKRWQKRYQPHSTRLQVVGSAAVGSRERVVIVELNDTWLVLGVGSGRVNKLHECPAPPRQPDAAPDAPSASGFAARFAHALHKSNPHQTPPTRSTRKRSL